MQQPRVQLTTRAQLATFLGVTAGGPLRRSTGFDWCPVAFICLSTRITDAEDDSGDDDDGVEYDFRWMTSSGCRDVGCWYILWEN